MSADINFFDLADAVLAGHQLTTAEALEVLQADDAQLTELVAAVARIRRHYFANRVKLNYLVSLKSGLCPENCNYCSQALGSTAPILKYSWLSPEQAVEQAGHGIAGGASRVCFVASGRGPAERDIDRVNTIVKSLKEQHPQVEVCACLGLLKQGQAERLRDAGVDAYNHNINTAESFHDSIVQTHSYQDRTETIGQAKESGLSPCSGLIVGMGESDEQIIEALQALRELDSDSIPINFLIPFDGTPLAGTWELTPAKSLKIVALARLICPAKEIRLAGGREMHLRSLQGMALHLANSIFLGDYLTSEGQAAQADLELLADHGFVIEGQKGSAPNPRCTHVDAGAIAQKPVPRQRGAGTSQVPNA